MAEVTGKVTNIYPVETIAEKAKLTPYLDNIRIIKDKIGAICSKERQPEGLSINIDTKKVSYFNQDEVALQALVTSLDIQVQALKQAIETHNEENK